MDQLCPSELIASILRLYFNICGLPLFHQFGSPIFTILCPIRTLSLVCSRPNHLSLASLALCSNCLTRADPLIYWFRLLSILVTLNENLSIFVFGASSLASCQSVRATISKPYIKQVSLPSFKCSLSVSLLSFYHKSQTSITKINK